MLNGKIIGFIGAGQYGRGPDQRHLIRQAGHP